MEITQHFKASVKTVQLEKAMARRKSSVEHKPPQKAAINKKSTMVSNSFSKQAKEVCNKITALRNVLIENRMAYMRIGQHLKSATHMTDAERDLIDCESEKFLKYYTAHLLEMDREYLASEQRRQVREHIKAVLELLFKYLHSIEKIYLDQKKHRIQHELDTYRLVKLAADRKKIPVRPAGPNSGKLGKRQLSNGSFDSKEKLSSEKKADEQNDWDNDDWEDWSNETEETPLNISSRTDEQPNPRTRKRSRPVGPNSESSAKVALDEDIQKTVEQQENDEEDVLSADDVQLFEAENEHIYNLLQGVSDEVEQIEKNVVDIAQLQDIFTEKVAMQQHNIERIVSAVVGTTENVKDANEQIRQATQRNAGLRVWSLFFLLVMSFSLLFLDWYYD